MSISISCLSYIVYTTHLCYFVHNILLISNNIESGISSCHKLMWRRNCSFTLLRNFPGLSGLHSALKKLNDPFQRTRASENVRAARLFLATPKTPERPQLTSRNVWWFQVFLLRENHPNVSKYSTRWEINLSRMIQVKVPSYGTWLFSDGQQVREKTQLKWTHFFLKAKSGRFNKALQNIKNDRQDPLTSKTVHFGCCLFFAG